ncbi:MAG: transporter, family, cyanate transporter [Thermoleophilales bacterium]|nr:transporter, family, cyanate transporter [Thermoleophilales bacterium]
MSGRTAAGTGLTLAAIVAVGINLRIGVSSLGPLLEDMRATLGMSRPVAGVVTMIPLFALAAFTLVGARWAAAFGPRRVMLWGLTALALSTVARAYAPTAALLLLATVPLGVAMAVTGSALPVLIKDRFAGSAGAVTGTYVTALDIGAGVCALAAVPLAEALGDWRIALALTAVPAALALPFAARLDGTRSASLAQAAAKPTAALLRGRVVWLLAGVFGAQSICFVGILTWLPAAYEAEGWSPTDAGVAGAWVLLAAIPTAFAVPVLSDRIGDRRRMVVPVAVSTAIGVLGLAAWPTVLPFLWMTLFAVGSGALFPLALTLPLDVASDASQAGRLTGAAVMIGYFVSAFAPVAVGALRDLTGGFGVPFALLASSAALTAPLALALPPKRA